jgi:S-adenosylmethionine:tRNA ribosyltransferase-isomerase
MFSLSDYTYNIPPDLIAQESVHPPHDARMMVIDRNTGKIIDETTFWNLDTYLGKDRILFFNDSRVIRSRIILKNIPFKTSNNSE